MKVYANRSPSGKLTYNEHTRESVFNYTHNNPISLTMPYSTKSYISSYHLHPIFDMHMPEGYLFEVLKNLLMKEEGKVDDYTLFSYLAENIEGYLTFGHSEKRKRPLALEEIIDNEDTNLFAKLVKLFLQDSAIAGVQPKVLATLQDKATLSTKEYIVKSFGEEYPHLSENEYFCMRALGYAGIHTPRFWLSKNRQLLVVEKFTYKKEQDEFYGFEEFCGLFGYSKEKKYYGSYEQIAKAIAKISTQKKEDLEQFFKMTVMNYLLKNGDAHLKNFGMLYEAGMQKRFLAPAYDVVCTSIYLPKDKPALTLFGKKIWFSEKDLLIFGQKFCLLSQREAEACYAQCVDAVVKIRDEIVAYAKENRGFKQFSQTFVNILDFSIGRNRTNTFKDISDGVL